MDRPQLERRLRSVFNNREITELVRQLNCAVAAIDMLQERSPEVVQAFFSDMNLVSTNDVSSCAKHALEQLADELRIARRRPAAPIPSRQALRLAYTSES